MTHKLSYKFPIIMTLEDVLPAIHGREEFFTKDNIDHFIVNYTYNTPESFLCPNDADISPEESLHRKIRKECRGLIFDKDGKIVSRPFHKFHNLEERPEYGIGQIDLSQHHYFLEKLDGSMIRPYMLDGNMYWGTKMGHKTEVADFANEFVQNNQGYLDFAADMLHQGLTPIFEFCSRKNRVVIDYPVDKLELLAIRNMVTGEYANYAEMRELAKKYNVPLVDIWNVSSNDFDLIVSKIRKMETSEGAVVRFHDGHMIKVKAEQYVLLHKTKEQISLEKNVLKTILEDSLDDLVSVVVEEDLKTKLLSYAQQVNHNISEYATVLFEIVKNNKDISQKDFAVRVAGTFDAPARPLLFQARKETEKNGMNFKSVRDIVVKFVLSHTTSKNKVEDVRSIFNVKWQEHILKDE